jgi:hypothetical protein
VAKYEFVVDGVTVPVRNPLSATWLQPEVGVLANGRERRALKATVTWTFPRLRAAELQQLVAYYPADGQPISFRTFRPPTGGTPAQWVLCSGVMQPVEVGAERGGFYTGVSVTFNRVQVV